MQSSRLKSSMPNLNDDIMFGSESVPGGIKARYLAQTIDTVFASVLVGLTIAVLKRNQISDESLGPACLFVWFAYSIILTWLYGQTIGKKIMKVQVVTKAGDKASLVQIFIRETVGRAVAFPLGYLWACFRQDKAGWHDMISGTCVVSTDPLAVESGMGGMKKFILTAGVLGSLSGSVIYVMFFTPIPLKQFAKKMELAGFEIEGVDGSIAFGPRAARIAFKDEVNDFDLSDVRFSYDLWSVFKNNRIVIKNLSVSGGRFSSKASMAEAMKGSNQKPPEAQNKPSNDPQIARTQGKPKREPPSVLIEKIDIANLRFEAEGKIFNLKRFYLDTFLVEKGVLITDRFYLQSDLLNLDIAGLVLSKTEVKVSNYIRGTVRKIAFPKYLANDLSFEGKIDFDLEKKELRNLALGLCDRRLQVRKEGVGYLMQTYGLTVSSCFSSSVPFTQANVKIKFMPPMYRAEVLEGQMSIHNSQFRFSKQYGFVHIRGPKAYGFKFEPTPLWIMMGPSFPISLNQFPNEAEWLSDLYYGKPVSQLAGAEQGLLERDLPYFKGLPALRPQPFAQPTLQSTAQPSSMFQQRMPSSSFGRKIGQ